MNYDVFICHAGEDKEEVALPLTRNFQSRGLKVWIDALELTLGDSLRRRIDEGLSQSRFGIVVLSPAFFSKEWPQKELDGLVAREDGFAKVILPVWHNLTKHDVLRYSPILSDRLAVSTSVGLDQVAKSVFTAVCPGVTCPWDSLPPQSLHTLVSPALGTGDDPIPPEVAKDVLVESGHLCAACGKPSPSAIRWRECEIPRKEDLICLCRDCAVRAVEWDEETLKEYKKKPYVHRHLTPQDLENSSFLRLICDIPYDEFIDKHRLMVKISVASILKTDPERVRIESIGRGSTTIDLRLPRASAEAVAETLTDHLTDELASLHIKFVGGPEARAETGPGFLVL